MKQDKVAKLEALSVSIPLDTPIWASGLKIERREFFIIRLTTESGRQGFGFHKSRGLHLDRIALENLAPHVIGKDPWMVKKI